VLTAEENDLLCRVEGDAPMGQLMRRHWIPAALSEQLAEPDGTPVSLRILGEDLVAFRDSDGGLACWMRDARTARRRLSWAATKIAVCAVSITAGNSTSKAISRDAVGAGRERLAEKVKHKAYPVREAAGFVWIYMGPAESIPEFEAPPWAPTGKERVSIVRIDLPCNWAQIMEGQIDSAHSSSLHSSDMRPARVETAAAADTHWLRPSTDKSPRLQVQLTNYGFRYAAIRRPIKDAQTHDYVRITTYVAPFTALIPPNSSYNVTSVIVPKDDTSTYFHFIAWSETGGIDQEAWRKFCVAQVGIDLDRDYRPASDPWRTSFCRTGRR
jgi:phthalate 4,5-dioxygenase